VVVQPLEGIAHVAVFIDAPVGLVKVTLDKPQALVKKAFPFPDLPVLVPVEYIGLGDLGVTALDEHFLDKVLHVFNRGYPAVLVDDIENAENGIGDRLRGGAVAAADCLGGLVDGIGYFLSGKRYDSSITFSDEV